MSEADDLDEALQLARQARAVTVARQVSARNVGAHHRPHWLALLLGMEVGKRHPQP